MHWKGHSLPPWLLASFVEPKQRLALELRAIALCVYAPKYGTIALVVTRNQHGNEEFLATNDRHGDLTRQVLRKRSRWAAETLLRDAKQDTSLGACQGRVDQAMVCHVGLVLVTFVVQMLRHQPDESLAAVKERWQLQVLRAEEEPPPPSRACPPELLVTA